MTEQGAQLPRFMYVTPPRPCPYLAGHMERDVFVMIGGDSPDALHTRLTQLGFRRSHNVAYRPDCPGCGACVSVRVVVDQFRRGRSLDRVWRRNADLGVEDQPAVASDEQFALFGAYQDGRHGDGEMASMDKADFRSLVEDSTVTSRVLECRDGDGALIAACLFDVLDDGLSAVYSFFDPTLAARGLGNLMVLRLIDDASRRGLAYVYLGYWIADSPKMVYKARFGPLEALSAEGWLPFEAPAPVSG